MVLEVRAIERNLFANGCLLLAGSAPNPQKGGGISLLEVIFGTEISHWRVQMQQYTEPAMAPTVISGSLTDALIAHDHAQPDVVSIVKRDGDSVTELTSKEFHQAVRSAAKGIVAAGINPGDRVALMSRTRYEWTLLDYAIWYAGCVTVPIYETSSAEQVQWMVQDSGAVGLFVENNKHLETVHSIRTSLTNLVHIWNIQDDAIDHLVTAGASIADSELDARRAQVTPTSTATIIYTSGTTGKPKGCVLTHGNFLFLVRNVMLAVPEIFDDKKTSTLLFLPLAHVFGRIIEIAMVESGLKVAFAPDITNLVGDLQKFTPNFLLAVPRVFEKVFNGAQQKATNEGKEKIFNAAADVAIAYSQALSAGSVPLGLRVKHGIFDKLVYKKLRAAMGGKVQWSVSGGAALGARLGHFFRGIGLTILEGYGLSETSSASTVNRPTMLRVGSVGRAIPGVTLAIGPDGEVLIKGPHIFQGYWNNPSATAEAIDVNGWFHSGDIGHIDEDGYLFITGRKKELIVTAGGKNVAPAVIEDRLRANWLVSQCMVVGDNKPFIGCLITLEPDSIKNWLVRNSLAPTTSFAELSTNETFRAEIQAAVDDANKAVSQAESIRKWVLIDSDWSEPSGHLTPSLKLKRNVVSQQYNAEIEGLYA
jgi:long-chain acyl-CoA synthetase